MQNHIYMVFLAFWLRNVLCATTACTFSTSQLPRRALFPHLNFQKWSGVCVFCTFWLRNVLRATTACTFSTSQLQKVLRTWGVLSFFTCKCASRHHGMQSYFSTLRSHKSLEKQSVSRLSHFFAHLDLLSSETFFFLIFFLLLFSSLTLPTSAFHLSILSEVWLLNSLRLFLPVVPHKAVAEVSKIGNL